MASSRLDDDLEMDEWLRRRNAQVRGGAPVANWPGAVTLDDRMPIDRWQATRDRQVRDGPFLEAQPVRYVAARAAPPPTTPAPAPAPHRPSQAVAPLAPINPARTEVFRRGPDGKLHPIAGWHTTGPFAFDEWAHNIDVPGFADDMATIVVGAAGGVKAAAKDAFDRISLGGGLYGMAKAAWEDATDPKLPPHHRR